MAVDTWRAYDLDFSFEAPICGHNCATAFCCSDTVNADVTADCNYVCYLITKTIPSTAVYSSVYMHLLYNAMKQIKIS